LVDPIGRPPFFRGGFAIGSGTMTCPSTLLLLRGGSMGVGDLADAKNFMQVWHMKRCSFSSLSATITCPLVNV